MSGKTIINYAVRSDRLIIEFTLCFDGALGFPKVPQLFRQEHDFAL